MGAPGARLYARLLVLGAEDDPMARITALTEFTRRTLGIPQLYAHVVSHGGHGTMWVVQPAVMVGIFERFFAAAR
jgi:hypothetical protein